MRKLRVGWLLLASLASSACGGLDGGPGVPVPLGTVNRALKDASPSARAETVVVLVTQSTADGVCTGSVLGPRLVLTAAHCLGAAQRPNGMIDCATTPLPTLSPEVQARVSSSPSIHGAEGPPYRAVQTARIQANAARLCGDDVVLLELAEPLTQVRESVIVTTVPAAGSRFLAVGYGTDGVSDGNRLENPAAEVVCVGAACGDNRIGSRELLARSGACEGDSGSPAIDDSGRTFAMAVRSSADCSETAYLQLGPHIQWLAANAIEVAAADHQAPPQWASDVHLANVADAADGTLVDTTPTHVAPGCSCNLQRYRANPGALLVILVSLLRMLGRRAADR